MKTIYIKINKEIAAKIDCMANKTYEVLGGHQNGKMSFSPTDFFLVRNEKRKLVSVAGFNCQFVGSQKSQS